MSAKRVKRSSTETALRGERTKKRRARVASKRRAYFADRIMRGKLTSKMKRGANRLILADVHREKLAQEAVKRQAERNAAAEAQELDRLAGIASARETLEGSANAPDSV